MRLFYHIFNKYDIYHLYIAQYSIIIFNKCLGFIHSVCRFVYFIDNIQITILKLIIFHKSTLSVENS